MAVLPTTLQQGTYNYVIPPLLTVDSTAEVPCFVLWCSWRHTLRSVYREHNYLRTPRPTRIATHQRALCCVENWQGFKPPGTRVYEYKRGARTFSVYRATGEDPGVCEYHDRAQCLAPWFIEGEVVEIGSLSLDLFSSSGVYRTDGLMMLHSSIFPKIGCTVLLFRICRWQQTV